MQSLTAAEYYQAGSVFRSFPSTYWLYRFVATGVQTEVLPEGLDLHGCPVVLMGCCFSAAQKVRGQERVPYPCQCLIKVPFSYSSNAR